MPKMADKTPSQEEFIDMRKKFLERFGCRVEGCDWVASPPRTFPMIYFGKGRFAEFNVCPMHYIFMFNKETEMEFKKLHSNLVGVSSSTGSESPA